MSNIHTIRYDRYCIVCFLVWTWVWRYFSEIIVDIAMNRLPRRTQLSQKCWFLELLIKGICVLLLQNYLMITDSFLFINSMYIIFCRIFKLELIRSTNDKYFKNYILFVYIAIMFFIILLILIIFSIVFYWYVSSKEYWYAQMSIDMLKWALPRFHGLAVIKY